MDRKMNEKWEKLSKIMVVTFLCIFLFHLLYYLVWKCNKFSGFSIFWRWQMIIKYKIDNDKRNIKSRNSDPVQSFYPIVLV